MRYCGKMSGPQLKRAETTVRHVEVHHDLFPRHELGEVAGSPEIISRIMTGRERQRVRVDRPDEQPRLTPLSLETEPTRIHVEPVLLRDEIRHELIGDPRVPAPERRGAPTVGVGLVGPKPQPLQMLEARRHPKRGSDARHVIELVGEQHLLVDDHFT